MAIDLTGADAYFEESNHTRSASWASFKRQGPKAVTAAIAEAKRILAQLTKKDPDENLPTDATDKTEFPRYDYAVYEQALYLLENGIVADGAQANLKFIAGRTQPDEARERQTDVIAPAAMRWISRGRIMMTRG